MVGSTWGRRVDRGDRGEGEASRWQSRMKGVELEGANWREAWNLLRMSLPKIAVGHCGVAKKE